MMRRLLLAARVLADGRFTTAVLMLLAADRDTSREALVRLAIALSRHGWPQLGSTLREHPVVAADREILTLLTQVSGPHFAGVRDAARSRLDALD